MVKHYTLENLSRCRQLFAVFCLFRNCCGGWPAFFMSLLVIAGLTALVEQVCLIHKLSIFNV